MKIFFGIVVFLFAVFSFFPTVALAVTYKGTYLPTSIPTPSPTPTAAPVTSYELFWPITAGKVMGDPLYFFKTLKENFREFLMFSNFKKADYNIRLSEKRTVEAEKLLVELKDFSNAKKTLDVAEDKREKTLVFIQKAEKEGRYVVDLKNTLAGSLEKQRALLQSLIDKVGDEGKKIIEDNVSALNSTLSKLGK